MPVTATAANECTLDVDGKLGLSAYKGDHCIFSHLAIADLVNRSLEDLIDPVLLDEHNAALAGRATSLELTQHSATYLITLSPCYQNSGAISGCEEVALDVSAY